MRGVDVAGPPDGDPIVFVHGVMFTRKLWAPQREALRDEFRVVVPDLPGHGARADESFRLERGVEVVEETIERVADGSATVVGLSLGGYVATALAGRRPEAVDTLVISGSDANPVDSLETVTRVVSGAARLATKSDRVESGIERAAEWFVERRDLPPEMAAEIVDAGFYPRQFGIAGAEIAGRDFRRAFASYPGPALVLNGKWDLINRLGERKHIADAADASVTVLDGAGHVCNLEQPAEYVAAIRRAARSSSGPPDESAPIP